MRQAARITLFVQDRNGRLEAFPDLNFDVFDVLIRQTPMITRNPDGSRTFVFDLAEPGDSLLGRGLQQPALQSDRLKSQFSALAGEARALGLPLTASLAEAAELVAEAELNTMIPPHRRG